MSRPMNTMPTVRRGRTYHKSGPNDNRGLGGVCSVLAVALMLCAPPLVLLASERSRRTRYLALSDALDSDIVELNSHGLASSSSSSSGRGELLRRLRRGALVHGTTSRIDAYSTDAEMNVSIPGALTLRRNTEYCQWQEVQRQRCETCTRTVEAKDGSRREENYQCNCTKEYSYVKSWRGHRINSLMFDQVNE